MKEDTSIKRGKTGKFEAKRVSGVCIGAIVFGSFLWLMAGNTQVFASQSSGIEAVTVIVDGQKISCSPDPIIESDRILVPVKSLLESLGFSVEWDDHLKLAKGRMTMADGSKRNISVNTLLQSMSVWEIRLNGDRISFIIPLDPKNAPIKNIDDHLLLPIGVIAKAVGYEIEWDSVGKTAEIKTGGAKISPPVDWIGAIEKHYTKYAPDQLAAKQGWLDDEAGNQRILNK